VTAGWVAFDGTELVGPSEFQQTFAGNVRALDLAAGVHSFQLSIASHPGTLLQIEVVAAGPVINSFAPIIAGPGELVTLNGEGLGPQTLIDVGGANYVVASASADETQIVVRVPNRSPIGPFSASLPIGRNTTTSVFTPTATIGLLNLYPLSDFQIIDTGACVAPRRFRLIQDGAKVAFVIDLYRPLPPEFDLSVAIDNDNNPTTVELPIRVSRQNGLTAASGATGLRTSISASTVVVSATFGALDLNNARKMGRMFARISAASSCGSAEFPSGATAGSRAAFVDFRTAFAPGLLLFRTVSPTPASFAARHGLALLEYDVENDLGVIAVPTSRTLQDTLLDLATDSEIVAVIPDPVNYQAAIVPDTSVPCGVLGPVFENAPRAGGLPPFSQWYLANIGLKPDASELPSIFIGTGIVVAVLDSGVNPDLEFGSRLLPGFDALVGGGTVSTDLDPAVHGTQVASIIAAGQNNGGIIGVAPAAMILPIRVTNEFGVGEGYAIYRAIQKVINLKTRLVSPLNIQVVNISGAEFVDTYFLLGSFISDLASIIVPAGVQAWVFAAGLTMHQDLHDRARGLISTGTALVASAGNVVERFGGEIASVTSLAGMQYPANVSGAFAVGALDTNRSPRSDSTRAIAGQSIALSAPGTAIVAADGTPTYGCFGGTSAAAPIVSGAIAYLLKPPFIPPLAASGVQAGQLLIQNARVLSAPPEAVGAGEVNLSTILVPASNFVWRAEFNWTNREILDFAFLPGISDFALRGSSDPAIHRISVAGVETELVTCTSAPWCLVDPTWLVGVETSNQLIVGGNKGFAVLRSNGDLLGLALPSAPVSPMFRAAVSSSWVAGAPLVALPSGTGTVNIRSGNALMGPNLAVIMPSGIDPFVGAQWAAMPNPPDRPGTPHVVALRTKEVIEYYEVPNRIADCPTDPNACPHQIGLSLLPNSLWNAVGDWALTSGLLGPRAYFANGTTQVFVAEIGGTAAPVDVGQSVISTLAANPRREVIYASDYATGNLSVMRGSQVIGIDKSNPSDNYLQSGSVLRIAPGGTYGYMRSDFTTFNPNAKPKPTTVWHGIVIEGL
jgi:hypothetical protein